ncbi:uncharacterized protein LOC132614290 [Lycium barbarum]|uniref:uncharacterized protein LOC132614290 n=1 Tax=Lycium barbarum TaxID=112863 RepID=UPI00293F08CF|nr:uncharacterized protein LOC132614290 [Lycium barbarum]XP_060184686.1 uncharacterized protein LOC132614290 [Lycium barbarum]
MEAANFEEHGVHCRGKLISCEIRQVPQQLGTCEHADDNNNTGRRCNYPTLFIQFLLTTHMDVWYLTPQHPSELLYMDESHDTDTKSFHLKLSHSEYLSYTPFYRIIKRNLNNWGGATFSTSVNIDSVIRGVRDSALTKRGTQNLEMSVGLTFKIECILDGRRQELSSRLNVGMVPASKTSIMQLPERMEIDEDQCLNDDCPICYAQLGKEGERIVCMPCSHMFHGDCITTWLDRSHYCPICRYDMPTTTTKV